ncbi:glycosyltransferase family 2 protein [Membranicola marinus]|uniref:Glycosyltransferase family 2 protein n=1 Tax=Membranihabitans marinus TaxID=1227546 RepID=A0A953HRK8_9BACT|nr:glycosyltransferase family 2 protein [Membranihabitans marinus]MBY5956613.1 glycosyltransferase family 2 protein [Membranihabitans marinus]
MQQDLKNRSTVNQDVLIIIVTYNGEAWIQNCIQSLIEDPDSDIIIIDCNSTDNSKSIVKSFGDRIITFFSEVNLGFGKANNIGLRYAIENNYNFVFLVNQDTVCEPGIIRRMKMVSKSNADYGILSPMHYFNSNTLDRNFENYLKRSKTRTITHLLNQQEVIPVDFINAAFWFIPIDVIHQIGGFDPIFDHYGEDNDLINRLVYINKKIGVIPDCKAYHLRNQNSDNKTPSIQSVKNRYHRHFLLLLKNPVNKYKTQIIKMHQRLIRYVISSGMRFDWKKLMGLSMAYFTILGKLSKISKHRKYYTVNDTNLKNIKFQNNLFINENSKFDNINHNYK